MTQEFVPYEQALVLKELGFDEDCFGYYEDNNLTITFPSTSPNGWKWFGNSIIPAKNTKAPTFSQAFRFFREKHSLDCYIDRGGAKGVYHAFVGGSEHGFLYGNNGNSPSEFTYEEAELECLKKLIEIVKKQGGDK